MHNWLPESQRHAILKPILKKDGLDAKDVKSYRPISNLTFISKLVERLVNLQLTEFLEKSGLFPKLQSGFRARHSTETALLKVMSDIMASTDKGNITLLGLLDMSAAFDTVDHHILLDRLEVSYGLKGHVLSWLRSFLSNRTQQVLMNGSSSLVTRIKSGVPQGSILGPLLFLLYTADIPCLATKHGINIHCYADDGQLYLYSRADMADNVVKKVVGCISEIDAWMSSNRLKLNADKTQFTWLGTRQQLDKINIPSINLGSSAVQLQSYVNNLGVIFDQKLSMKQHVDKISRSAFYYLRQLRVIRKSLTTKACEALVHAFVSSRLDYCNCLLYGVGETQLKRLQSVLRAAARLVLRKLKYDSISADIRDRLHWLPVKQRIEFKICVLVFKCRSNEAPVYLSEMLHAVQRPTRYNLRSDTRLDYDIPRCSSVRSGPRSFAVSGPTLWNSLPNSLKDCVSLSAFKTGLKAWLFKKAFG